MIRERQSRLGVFGVVSAANAAVVVGGACLTPQDSPRDLAGRSTFLACGELRLLRGRRMRSPDGQPRSARHRNYKQLAWYGFRMTGRA